MYWTDADAPVDIWGNNAVLAYVPQGSEQLRDRYMPSYGYTYVMSGHPIAEPAFWDNARASWKYPVEMERVPVVSGISAGYLIISPN